MSGARRGFEERSINDHRDGRTVGTVLVQTPHTRAKEIYMKTVPTVLPSSTPISTPIGSAREHALGAWRGLGALPVRGASLRTAPAVPGAARPDIKEPSALILIAFAPGGRNRPPDYV
jgi:hypothetical protein